MFDSLFGQATASAAADTYLERMERVLRIEALAKELGEEAFRKSVLTMLEKLVEVTNLELTKTINELKSSDDKKASTKETN